MAICLVRLSVLGFCSGAGGSLICGLCLTLMLLCILVHLLCQVWIGFKSVFSLVFISYQGYPPFVYLFQQIPSLLSLAFFEVELNTQGRSLAFVNCFGLQSNISFPLAFFLDPSQLFSIGFCAYIRMYLCP